MFHYYRKSNFTIKVIALAIIFVFAFSSLCPSYALAQSVSGLPMPGTMVSLSPVFTPTILRGLRVYPDNSLKFDFIVDSGDTGLKGAALKNESERLIKYFLAALTIPEDNLWVNLSPHEQDRVIPDSLAKTDMGTDMLAQDYLLKQVTASLIYPEDELGKQFWQKIYKKAYEEYGTTNIPVDTFNKVWIMPERAEVYVKDDRAFVVESRLKVMLEEDYVAFEKETKNNKDVPILTARSQSKRNNVQNLNVKHLDTLHVRDKFAQADLTSIESLRKSGAHLKNNLASDIVREIVIPALEKEVNEGKNFARLRQIYNSLILAYWFKNNLKESILNKVYSDQSKIKGVDTKDISQDIYNQYIDSFKKGVCDFIKVEYDQYARKNIPRKYFSGGVKWELDGVFTTFTGNPYLYAEESEKNTTYIATTNLAPDLASENWVGTATNMPEFSVGTASSLKKSISSSNIDPQKTASSNTRAIEGKSQALSAPFIPKAELLDKIKKADYQNFGNMIRTVIRDKEEHMIATWGATDVVEIPGLKDEFCLKFNSEQWKLGPPEMIEDILPGYNVGQPVAKVGNVLILRRQRGRQAGIHEDIQVEKRYDARALRKDYIEYLQKVSKMPQSAFDKLVHIMSVLVDKGYQIDAGASANLLIDFKAKEFPIVDVMPKLEEGGKSLLGLVSMLIDIHHLVTDYEIKPIPKVLKKEIHGITKKLISGFDKDGIKKELPSLEQFKANFDKSFPYNIRHGKELEESAFDELYGNSLDDILRVSSSASASTSGTTSTGDIDFNKKSSSTIKTFEIGQKLGPNGHMIAGGESNGRAGRDSREIITVDWEKDTVLQNIYANVTRRLDRGKSGKDTLPFKLDFLETVYDAVYAAIKYDGNAFRNKAGQEILIGDSIEENGVCRHMGILVAALLEKMIQEGWLNGKAYYVRGEGHGWAVYETKKGEFKVFDVAQNYFGEMNKKYYSSYGYYETYQEAFDREVLSRTNKNPLVEILITAELKNGQSLEVDYIKPIELNLAGIVDLKIIHFDDIENSNLIRNEMNPAVEFFIIDQAGKYKGLRDGEKVIIGRKKYQDRFPGLEDMNISRSHITIRRQGNKIFLKDGDFTPSANSTNIAYYKNVSLEDELEEMSAGEKEIKKASSNLKGGIDFNAENMDVTTKGDEIDFDIPLDMQNIDFNNIEGFVPIIINITPIANFMGLLGLDDGENGIEKFSQVQEFIDPVVADYEYI